MGWEASKHSSKCTTIGLTDDTLQASSSGLTLFWPPLGPVNVSWEWPHFRGELYYKAYFGNMQTGLNTGVTTSLKGIHIA